MAFTSKRFLNLQTSAWRSNNSRRTFFFLSFILTGCQTNDHPPSTDIDELKNIVKIDTNLKSARWEIFTTPEYQDGVPGPTDYISLVIEIENSAIEMMPKSSQPGMIWIAPEAARPWMTKETRLFFERFKNKTVDIAAQKNCNRVTAWLSRTNKQIDGIACKKPTSGLIYFVLADYTA